MPPPSSQHSGSSCCWRFTEESRLPATGVFSAVATEHIGRLYFPLVNEAGAFSWTSPQLHGGLAASHHEYLAPPLTAEDLPQTLLHRGVWLVLPGRPPWSVSGIAAAPPGPSVIDAGPGWFRLTRHHPDGDCCVSATLWCPADVPWKLELMQVELTNASRRPLPVILYAALPIFARSADNLRDHRHVTALLHRVQRLPEGVIVSPTMSFDERGHRPNRTRYAVLALGPNGERPEGVWAVQEQFLGDGGTFAAPAAVWQRWQGPDPRQAARPGQEAVGGFRFHQRSLRPGRRAVFLIVSGITQEARDISRWIRWARRSHAAARSLAITRQHWQQTAQRVACATADPTLNHWLAWVGIQPHLRRLYGNSYLPQFDYGRGGRGWRDLWQDGLALSLSDPASARPMLLHTIGGIRMDGSNATIIGTDGRFIADRNNIPRTWMDHGAWPVSAMLLYIDQTGDLEVVLEPREYLRDPPRGRGGTPRVSRGSVFEHLVVQTLTAFFNVGAHNVCRLEGADWNDGLDMAAQRGESVAFSAFYAWNLARLARFAEELADRGVRSLPVREELLLLLDRLPGQRPVNYRSATAKRARLEGYLEAVARDLSGRMRRIRMMDLARDLQEKHADLAGRIRTREWIRIGREGCFNGYYDNRGRRVEGAHRRGVRMTLTGQVFPLMSGIATPAQVDAVIRSVNRYLRDPRSGGIRLNTNFGAPQPELGRAFSFAYGEKENGAVFSHMAVMYAYSLYTRRRPLEGRAVWTALYRMATDQPRAKIFPGLPEYFNREGRGMYAYLTGSASWLIFLFLTQVFGVRGELGDLVLDPQLTREDFGRTDQVSVRTTFVDRPLHITVTNPERLEAGRYRVTAVRAGTTPLACTPLPPGGIRIARRLIAQLPPRTLTTLRVSLGLRA